MEECFICGISGEKSKLSNVISRGGIVKVCGLCSLKESFPKIKETIYNKKEEPPKVPTNLSSKISAEKKKPKESASWLVDHFHWVIMRARRSKHLTQKQLAKAIGESDETIANLERGVISKYNFQLINKVENQLGINLVKLEQKSPNPAEVRVVKEAISGNPVKLDPKFYDNLTLDDLQKLREQHKLKTEVKNPEDNFSELGKDLDEIDLKEIDSDEEKKKEDIGLWDVVKMVFGRK